MAHNPVVGTGTFFASANGSANSTAFSVKSDSLRVTSIGTRDVKVAIGTNPTATSVDYAILADTSETLGITPKSQPVIGLTTGTTTTLVFPEGTGCAFNVGDCVTVTGLTPASLNTSHSPVNQILTSAAPQSGYYSTRCVLDWNSTGDTVGAASTFTYTTGRATNSLKLSAFSDGTGSNVALIQVQVSGDA